MLRLRRLAPVLVLAVALGTLAAACRPAAPGGAPADSCASYSPEAGYVIDVVWSTPLVAPGGFTAAGDPALANRIAFYESRCTTPDTNSNDCVGYFQLCGHGDAWAAAYGQPNCAPWPSTANGWCAAWAGYILWWNGGHPSYSPWRCDPAVGCNVAYRTGQPPVNLVAYRTTRPAVLTTSGGAPQDVTAEAALNWLGVVAWNDAVAYEQAVAAAQAQETPHAGHGGGGGGGCSAASVRQHESGGNYSTNTGNGYYGAYQESPSHWGGYMGYPEASDAPPAIQDQHFALTEPMDPGAWAADGC